MAVRERLSAAEARRAVLWAQGFGRRSDAAVSRRLIPAVRRLGALQIDSVNVLARAHYLPLFSRLGPYDRASLDASFSAAPRRLFEYWGHEASLMPVSTQPLLRWRMARVHDDAWGGMLAVHRDQPDLVRDVAAIVRGLGPLTSAEVERELRHEEVARGKRWGWNWSAVKRALELLFWSGEITSAGRDRAFRRRYAPPERVLPPEVLRAPTPPPMDARRELLAIAARAQGVATTADLADHFRMSVDDAAVAVADLVEAGRVVPVSIPGWPPAFASSELRVPRRIDARGLLAPFDPLVWTRPRVERLFGMRYRVEIYVPADRRVHGYYVLPYIYGDRLVARVDLKADRRARALLVRRAHAEPGMPDDAAEALAGDLSLLAHWLGLDEVAVAASGPLADRIR